MKTLTPYETLQSRITELESKLGIEPNIDESWIETDISSIAEILKVKEYVAIKFLDIMPIHRIFGKLYYNENKLNEFVAQNAQKIKALE